jgi:hypothetical protein
VTPMDPIRASTSMLRRVSMLALVLLAKAVAYGCNETYVDQGTSAQLLMGCGSPSLI